MDLTLTLASGVDVAAPVSTMRVALLDDWAAVEKLEPEWNRLLHQSSVDSIFLTWEWVRCWADVMGRSNIRPLVICVRDERGDLVGIAPFYIATLRLGHVLPYRVLRIMGDYPTGADYPDLILRRNGDEAITAAIVKALKSRRGWDLIWMPGMAGWTGSFDRIVAASGASGLLCRSRSIAFAVVPLPPVKEAYVRSLSKNKRQQLRAETKRVLERPGVEISRCDADADVPAFLEALFDLHSRRWEEKGDTGTFNSRPQEVDFYRKFVPVALRNGWLRLYAFRDGGEIKAIQIGYVYRNVFHQLQEGFDPSYVKGVGNVTEVQGVRGLHRRRRCGVRLPGRDDRAQAALARNGANRPRSVHRPEDAEEPSALQSRRLAVRPLHAPGITAVA